MKIKICDKNTDKINTAIKEAEGRATARCIDCDMISGAVSAISEKLNIPKKYMAGVSAVVDLNAQNFPNAYKGIPESTQFKIEFNRKAEAFLVSVSRGACRTPGKRFCIYHTEESKAAIIESLSSWG